MPSNHEHQPGRESETAEQPIEKVAELAVRDAEDAFDRPTFDDDPIGPGILEDAGIPPDLDPDSVSTATPPPAPQPVRLSRPDDGPTADQNLWTLIRNRTDAISFNNYTHFLDAVLCGEFAKDTSTATRTLPRQLQRQVNDLSFLGLDGYDVVRAATEYFLMQEVGLVVEDFYHALDPNTGKPVAKELNAPYLQKRYDHSMGVDGIRPGPNNPGPVTTQTSEFRRRNDQPLSQTWLLDLRDQYLVDVSGPSNTRVLPYLNIILERLRDIPLKSPGEVAGDCYGVLPSKVVGPLGLELIWNYWHEEGMLVQAHNAITNRFQNLRSTWDGPDPLARLELDPLRRLNNILWGWIQNRPFLLSVRRRAYEYDHQYGITLLGTAAGEVQGADSRSQFISAFHNLLHLSTIFYQQDDDLTVKADGFPLLNALRETQLVLTAGAHNQYGDLPWTARVEMLLQMWMLGRPEMREFLGGRVMVPYKEGWMDRVDSVKSMMDWTDVNVTHFRDLGVFGEQILLSIRFGSWATEIDPAAAVNWARYWRPEIQGYLHAYRAATGADLRQTVDTTMPGMLLASRLGDGRGDLAGPRAVAPAKSRRAVTGPAPARALGPAQRPAIGAGNPAQMEAQPVQAAHELP